MLKTRSIETRTGRLRIIECALDKGVGAAPLKSGIEAAIRGEAIAEARSKEKGKAEEKSRKEKEAAVKKEQKKKEKIKDKDRKKKTAELQRMTGR